MANVCQYWVETTSGTKCILPEVAGAINRRTGESWVKSSVDEEGKTQYDYSAINGYNDGQCNGAGTQTTCSGYAPYILKFGDLAPSAEDVKKIETYRLPLSYEICNLRAEISKCYFWSGSPATFSIDSTGKISDIESQCIQGDTRISDYKNGKNTIPCNGAKPECPHYTGACWKHSVESNMETGDKVLADQILELRWQIKKEAWDRDDYYDTFADPEIYAWKGKIVEAVSDPAEGSKSTSKTLIPAIRTLISDFEFFQIEKSDIMLSDGTGSDDRSQNYPTLVKRLSSAPLSPVIRNKFDIVSQGAADIKIFESGARLEPGEILLVGDTFSSESTVYAFNLSDPELSFFPKEFKEHKSMYAIQKSLSSSSFDNFYSKFEELLNRVIYMMPDKVGVSEVSSENWMFYNSVKAVWGENILIVFAKIRGRWEYDTITVQKPYIGGVIGQTSFSINGDGGEVDYLPNYEKTFGADLNDNGQIRFRFFPMVGNSSLAKVTGVHVYIDGVRQYMPEDPLMIMGSSPYEFAYKLYKLTIEDTVVEKKDLRFFGNAGYCYVFLNDKRINSAVKPWEIDGSIFLNVGGKMVEMEIYEWCTDRLPTNCFIIKPKNIDDFSAPCDDAFLTIPELVVYSRGSFAPPSDMEGSVVVKESFAESTGVIYRSNLRIDGSFPNYSLSGFGDDPLGIAAVYKGPTGRFIGQVKTKLITWSRQPFCRDVEIYYSWQALYIHTRLLPDWWCLGDVSEEPLGTEWLGYSPDCGDHQRSWFTGKGPMWYPYQDCADIGYYNYNTAAEKDLGMMEIFNNPEHGANDMRMLGPDDHYGKTGESHARIWNCTCDFTYYNYHKQGGNVFVGYSNYRGGLDAIAKMDCVRSDGDLPKFGNVYRDFLRSYRSMDNIYYYVWDGTRYARRNKWVPMYEFYSPSPGSLLSTYPYFLYMSNDYDSEDKSLFIPQFGCLLAINVEGVDISEEIDGYGSAGSARLRFEDVFRTHYVGGGIYYPTPKNPQYKMIGGNLVPIMPWYTYRDGADGQSIQWAWQEYWKEIERQSTKASMSSIQDVTMLGTHVVVNSLPNMIAVPPYDENGKGQHIFLSISYPDYRYDGELKEHRLVCDEGTHVITVTPPEPNEDGGYDNLFWSLKIDDGPPRCFDSDGNWLVDEPGGGGEEEEGEEQEGSKCNVTLYETCTTSPWVEDITLFAGGYDSPTPDPDRTIISYDEEGEHETYYQRGLNVSVRAGALASVPRRLIPFEGSGEMRVNKLATCGDDYSSPWSSSGTVEDISLFYPFSNDVGAVYCSSDGDVEFTIKLEGESVGGVAIEFDFGARPEGTPVPGTVFSGSLFHIPGVKIYRSEDDNLYTSIMSVDSMHLATKSDGLTSKICLYTFPLTADVIKTCKYLKISFRLAPTSTELSDVDGDYETYFPTAKNKVSIRTLHIYCNEFIEGEETIKTYERLYNISLGGHGDFPPHGYDSTGSLLYVMNEDRSTVYQMDSLGGVVGMPNSAGECASMNKLRGRRMKAVTADKTRVPGSLYDWEGEQKKIHDAIAIDTGSTEMTFKSCVPPNLSYLLGKAGCKFPSWTCDFVNTLILPLAAVNVASPYSAAGHIHAPDFQHSWRTICIHDLSLTWRYGYFRYGAPGTALWSFDVLLHGCTQYWILTMAMADWGTPVTDRVRQAGQRFTQMFTPPPPDPVY